MIYNELFNFWGLAIFGLLFAIATPIGIIIFKKVVEKGFVDYSAVAQPHPILIISNRWIQNKLRSIIVIS